MNPILFLFGYRRIRAQGIHAVRLLNLCLENSFSFTDFVGEADGSVTISCPLFTARRLLRLAEARGISLAQEGGRGLPSILWKRGRRYGLLLGSLCALALIWLSGRIVWDVEVTGNQRLTAGDVRAILSECGFGVGSPLKHFHAGELENRVLLRSDELAWISVNVDGTVARVQVVERTAPAKESGKKPANLIAARDGQIESVMLYRGECVVKQGQAVRAGELLVSGIYDSQSVGVRFTRAAGRILARTERSFRVEIPLETTEKVLWKEEKSGIWLNFFQKSVKIFKNTGNQGDACDIIKVDNHFSGFGSRTLPVSLTVEIARYYREDTVFRGEAEALDLAYQELDATLSRLSGEVQILRKDIATTVTERSLILDCTLLCIEDIAIQSEFDVE